MTFGAPDETIISSKYDRPVFVHHYPSRGKSLLHEGRSRRSRAARSAAICWRPKATGEIIGGGQREDSLDTTEAKKSPSTNYNEKDFDLVHGSAPLRHLPARRALVSVSSGRSAWICGLPHIRETHSVPAHVRTFLSLSQPGRDQKRLSPTQMRAPMPHETKSSGLGPIRRSNDVNSDSPTSKETTTKTANGSTASRTELRLGELEVKNSAAFEGGGADRDQAKHKEGTRLTARERLDVLRRSR